MVRRTPVLSFLQKDIEERVVNPNLAVVFDEAQFSEAIHEKTDSRPEIVRSDTT